MRRRIPLAACAIALGVFATYATAWAAVWWGPIGKVTATSVQVSVNGWTDDALKWPWPIDGSLPRPTDVDTKRAWGVRMWSGFNEDNLLHVVDKTQAEIARSNGLNPFLPDQHVYAELAMKRYTLLFDVRAGWPLTCVRRGVLSVKDLGGESVYREYGLLGKSSYDGDWPQIYNWCDSGLPLQPVWPLFVANVTAWGSAFAAVGVGLATLFRGRRIARRRRRGLCVACGYDLAGLAPRGGLAGVRGGCPECGTGMGAAA